MKERELFERYTIFPQEAPSDVHRVSWLVFFYLSHLWYQWQWAMTPGNRILLNKFLLARIALARNPFEQPLIREWVSLFNRFRGTLHFLYSLLFLLGFRSKVYRKFRNSEGRERWAEIPWGQESDVISQEEKQGYKGTVYWRLEATPLTYDEIWALPCSVTDFDLAFFLNSLRTICSAATPIWVIWERVNVFLPVEVEVTLAFEVETDYDSCSLV